VLGALVRDGRDAAEVYWKRGRSRRLELGPGDGALALAQEEGWAVRAGDGGGSFFLAATGRPSPAAAWPATGGGRLRLPEGVAVEDGRAPGDLDAALVSEGEARAILDGIARELHSELPGARLVTAALEDGASESELASSRGVRARWRSRAAWLRLEAAAPGTPLLTVALQTAARDPRGVNPSALARSLADRLLVRRHGAAPDRDRGEFVLGPAVAARLLHGLLPLVVGPQAAALQAPLLDRRGRLGSEAVTLVDDGALADGVLQAPVDGEGVPTREVVLVERGVFRQPLLAWWQARPPQAPGTGCSRRPSWRDLPRPGPTHLYFRPRPEVAATALLGGVTRGYYLLDTTGAGRFDLAADRFALPVCGFAVHGGRASAPVGRAWLAGPISAFLRGVQGVGRDLTFLPLDGMIGAPSLLATGLELRAAPGDGA
jgi:predicted Zn-dependent protease